jgi:predicted lipid-binding transport protein (Tim44 family)
MTDADAANPTTEKETSMDQNETEERIHSVEVAQATQTATLAGAQATQAAAQAGTTATNAAMHAGLLGTMAAGSVSLIVGIFLGIAIRGARS